MDQPTNPGIPIQNLDLSDVPFMECESCKGQSFILALMFKKVSKFMTGSPQDTLVPMEIFSCVGCGHVNSEFIKK